MDNLDLSLRVVNKIRQCGHFIRYKTGGRLGRRRILTILMDNPGILQVDLQERLKIQSGSMSEIIIKLENDGLIIKKRSIKDARKWSIELTEYGKEEAIRLKKEYHDLVIEMMSCFDKEKLEAFESDLEYLLDHWNKIDIEE